METKHKLSAEEVSPKKHDCKNCHTVDISKYTAKRYNICRDCTILLSGKKYECNVCRATDKELFIEGRYTRCKKCRSKKSSVITVEKYHKEKIIESDLSKEDIEKIEKYIYYNTRIFNGETIKETIDALNEKYIQLNNNYVEIFNKLELIENKIDNIKRFMNK